MFCSRERKELLKFHVKWFHISKLFQLSQFDQCSQNPWNWYIKNVSKFRTRKKNWTISMTAQDTLSYPASSFPLTSGRQASVRSKERRLEVRDCGTREMNQKVWRMCKIILNHTDLGLELSTIFYEPYADCSSINLVVTLHSISEVDASEFVLCFSVLFCFYKGYRSHTICPEKGAATGF